MKRVLAVLAFAALAGLLLVWVTRAASTSSSFSAGDLRISGRTQAEQFTVVAPFIEYPQPDHAVGIPIPAGARSAAPVASAVSAPKSAQAGPALSGRISAVKVGQGDSVTEGQELMRFETALLDLGVEEARLAARRARADVDVITDRLADIEEKQDDVASAKRKLASARAALVRASGQLSSARSTLLSARAKAVAGRVALRSQIRKLEKLLAAGRPAKPGGAPGGTPPKAPQPDPRKTLKALRAKLAQVETGIRKIDAGLRKVAAGRARVGSGFGQLASARSRLIDAEAELADAREELRAARRVLRAVAEGRAVGVSAAKAVRASARLTAPADGIVTFVLPAGTAVMAGAPVVRIRSLSATKIETYLTAEQTDQVEVGDSFDVAVDTLPGAVTRARVTDIGGSYRFPPSRLPTELVHMTRVVRAVATLEPRPPLPPGLPADLTLRR